MIKKKEGAYFGKATSLAGLLGYSTVTELNFPQGINYLEMTTWRLGGTLFV